MLEYNFSLFFGLAVQLYEMTLISDDAPIDRFFEGQTARAHRPGAPRPGDLQRRDRGYRVLRPVTRAPSSPTTRGASSTARWSTACKQPAEMVERMFNGECEVVAYDQGVYNIGVRPTEEDLGHGSNDPFGNPLSFIELLTLPASEIPSQELLTLPDPQHRRSADHDRRADRHRGHLQGARACAISSSPRRTSTTAGSARSAQVVEFYNRGGDFREHNVENIDFEIGKLNLTEQQIDDLVAFLGRPLTDVRVVRQSAPFDHPQLFVPNGHHHGRRRSAGRPTKAWLETACSRSRKSDAAEDASARGFLE